MTESITVESCLAELREMFPEFKMRTVTTYDPDPGLPYTTICLARDEDRAPARAFTGASLADCMARARNAWKESQ